MTLEDAIRVNIELTPNRRQASPKSENRVTIDVSLANLTRARIKNFPHLKQSRENGSVYVTGTVTPEEYNSLQKIMENFSGSSQVGFQYADNSVPSSGSAIESQSDNSPQNNQENYVLGQRIKILEEQNSSLQQSLTAAEAAALESMQKELLLEELLQGSESKLPVSLESSGLSVLSRFADSLAQVENEFGVDFYNAEQNHIRAVIDLYNELGIAPAVSQANEIDFSIFTSEYLEEAYSKREVRHFELYKSAQATMSELERQMADVDKMNEGISKSIMKSAITEAMKHEQQGIEPYERDMERFVSETSRSLESVKNQLSAGADFDYADDLIQALGTSDIPIVLSMRSGQEAESINIYFPVKSGSNSTLYELLMGDDGLIHLEEQANLTYEPLDGSDLQGARLKLAAGNASQKLDDVASVVKSFVAQKFTETSLPELGLGLVFSTIQKTEGLVQTFDEMFTDTAPTTYAYQRRRAAILYELANKDRSIAPSSIAELMAVNHNFAGSRRTVNFELLDLVIEGLVIREGVGADISYRLSSGLNIDSLESALELVNSDPSDRAAPTAVKQALISSVESYIGQNKTLPRPADAYQAAAVLLLNNVTIEDFQAACRELERSDVIDRGDGKLSLKTRDYHAYRSQELQKVIPAYLSQVGDGQSLGEILNGVRELMPTPVNINHVKYALEEHLTQGNTPLIHKVNARYFLAQGTIDDLEPLSQHTSDFVPDLEPNPDELLLHAVQEYANYQVNSSPIVEHAQVQLPRLEEVKFSPSTRKVYAPGLTPSRDSRSITDKEVSKIKEAYARLVSSEIESVKRGTRAPSTRILDGLFEKAIFDTFSSIYN